jgi:ABC-type glycerol-3-phosphate transport system permease component
MARPRLRSTAARAAAHVLLALLVLLSLGPFLFVLAGSLGSGALFAGGRLLPTLPLRWGNYAEAWAQVRGYFVNSMTVTTVSVAAGLALAGLAAYGFSRFRFAGSGVLFALVVVVLIVPGVLTLVPLFVVLRDFGLFGTHGALYAVYVTESLALGILVLRTGFASVPEELLEAAELDGAGELSVALRVVAPLAAPAFVTAAIMATLTAWNDYLWPLIVLPDERRWTIARGLVAFRDRYAGMAAWGPLFAGFAVASIPLLALFFAGTRRFVTAITSGAIKA